MKSLKGNIFEQIASVENIVAAIHSAAKGKRHKRANAKARKPDVQKN